MAGMGKRMRPHTLTVPKPLIPIAGKPIVQHLLEDLAEISPEPIEEIAFIIGNFGDKVEKNLLQIAQNLGAKGSIHYQHEALGTAHAILCAKDVMQGKVIIAFADTLFRGKLNLEGNHDGIIWVNKIEDPSSFGVVKVNNDSIISDYVEKPTTWVSDLAMIGIYYFSKAEELKNELQYLIDNNIIKGGEYQLPDGLRRMTEKGKILKAGAIEEWLDCGNKDATVETSNRVLDFKRGKLGSRTPKKNENSLIIEPCYIGENIELENAIIGPFVSLGSGCKIKNSRIERSILQNNAEVHDACLSNSMMGESAKLFGKKTDLSISDFSVIKL